MRSAFMNRCRRAAGLRRSLPDQGFSPISPNRQGGGTSWSTTWRICRTWRRRLASSFEINMFWATAQRIRRAMESTGRSASSWCSLAGCLSCTPSGGPVITRQLSEITLKRYLFIGAALMLAPFLLLGQSGKPMAATQPQASSQDSGEAVFSSETRLVPLNVTVMDKSGHRVTNLPQSAFTVLENGAPQQIRIFRREDVPVSMGLIIDNSGSMRDKREKVEAAALALVKDSNPQDEVFVVNFNDEAYKDLPNGKDFTSDINEMEEALKRIDSRGGTAMRDAIQLSIDHLKKAHRDKKVLVVVTDGNDNS